MSTPHCSVPEPYSLDTEDLLSENMFQCTLCSYATPAANMLGSHMRRQHAGHSGASASSSDDTPSSVYKMSRSEWSAYLQALPADQQENARIERRKWLNRESAKLSASRRKARANSLYVQTKKLYSKIEQLEETVSNRDATIQTFQSKVSDRDTINGILRAQVSDQNVVIGMLNQSLVAQGNRIEDLERLLAQQRDLIHRLNSVLKKRDDTIASLVGYE